MDLLQDALECLDVLRKYQLADQRQIHREPNPVRISGSLLGVDGSSKDKGGSVSRELLPDRQQFVGCGMAAFVLGIIGERCQPFELGGFG